MPFLALLGVAPARAATFTVNNAGDGADANPGNGICATAGSVCTLRAAIQEANALAGSDVINVPATTIVLGSALSVTEGVTINGAGQGVTIVDGNNAVQILNYAINSGSHILSNLTLRNGNTSQNGGAVFNQATLNVSNVTLTNNRARQGGGIYNELSFDANVPSLTLQSVLITSNTATTTAFGEGGGGLFNGSVLNGTNVTISANTAWQGGGYYNNSAQSASLNGFAILNNTAYSGGGIDNDLGSISLSNGTVSGNIAQYDGVNNSGGGGVYNNEGSITLTSVTVSGNRATSPGGYGGGIYNFRYVTLVRVSVTDNRAAYGAGLYNGNFTATPNNMSLTNVTVSNNLGTSSVSPHVDAVGGGIYNTSNGQLPVTNSTIAYNLAVVSGGIENLPSGTNNNVNLRNTILANNTATASSSPDCRGAIGSGGSNIVRDTSGCLFFAAAGDQTGVDPKLEVLRGSPAYHPLRLNSPAFQSGNNAFCPSTDQRGLPRPQGGACDKGAYEIGDVPVVGDWDGNGTVTIGFYRPWTHAWYLRNSNTSGTNDVPVILYGTDGDYPVVGDWNGDGVDTIGVYRPSEHVWYLRNSNTSGMNDVPAILYGTDADYPVVGDWNGDGVDTIGVYRPPEHVWYLRDFNSSGYNTVPAILYGVDGDLPVVGDWNGDLMDSIGVFRPSERIWYLRDANSSGFNTVPAVLYGDANDVPVAGDWNGDGTSTVGVYRPQDRVWYLRNINSSGANTVPAILY